MKLRRTLRVLACSAWLACSAHAQVQTQEADPGGIIHVASQLVVLDVTVLNKRGLPVLKGLTRDDFTVKEDDRPQSIASFAAPQADLEGTDAESAGTTGEAPATVLVLDLLNSTSAEAGFFRTELQRYLEAQPEHLAAPTDLMVLGSESLQSVQSYTHSRAALLAALANVPPSWPYKAASPDFYLERFVQTIYALEQIALQNNGVAGRKNILWLGSGFPNIHPADYTYQAQQHYFQFLRRAVNALVRARASLFVFDPPGNSMKQPSVLSAHSALGGSEPFAEDINLGVFVRETGGELFYNRNDVDNEIRDAQAAGSESYTLTYRPPQERADGSFRHIEVAVRGRGLHVLTKAGYFAPSGNQALDIQRSELTTLADAAQSTIPYNTLEVGVMDLVRHPASGTVQFTIALRSSRLIWNQAQDGTSKADATFAAISLSKEKDILASSVKMLTITAHTQNPALLPATMTLVPITVRVPRDTATVRVLVQAAEGGWLGSVDLTRERIAAAPAAPTPDPSLMERPGSK